MVLPCYNGSNLLGQYPVIVLGSLFVEQERTAVGDGSDGEDKVM